MKSKRKLRFWCCLLAAVLICSVPGSSRVWGAQEKKLYFEERSGTMTYTAVRDENENWFMSFLNMVPGVTYHDEMLFENRSKKSFDLYMQAIPREQPEILDELLKLIRMDIYYNGELFYSGNALGITYPGKVPDRNLQEVIPLGKYPSGKTGEFQVDVSLPADLDMKYCDLLTKIDWKFMVTEKTTPNKPGGGDPGGGDPPDPGNPTPPDPTDGPPKKPGRNTPADGPSLYSVEEMDLPLMYITKIPKTGDELGMVSLALTAFASGVGILVIGAWIGKSRKKQDE